MSKSLSPVSFGRELRLTVPTISSVLYREQSLLSVSEARVPGVHTYLLYKCCVCACGWLVRCNTHLLIPRRTSFHILRCYTVVKRFSLEALIFANSILNHRYWSWTQGEEWASSSQSLCLRSAVTIHGPLLGLKVENLVKLSEETLTPLVTAVLQ